MIYMDNSATTRMKKEVLDAMMPYFQEHYGNPSSLHAEGQAARRAVERSRETIAKALGCNPDNLTFTSGATEANNLFYANVFNYNIVYTIEGDHPSIVRPLNRHQIIPCLSDGEMDINAFKEEVDFAKRYGLLSQEVLAISYANGEVGVIQPAEQILALGVPVHWDVTQAIGSIPVSVKKLMPFSMAFGAHKFGGPKGVGVLYHAKPIQPAIFGGGQERGIRSGTENVPGIVGMAKAVELATKGLEKRTEYVRKLAAKLAAGILTDISGSFLNGPGFGPKRLPGNVNVSFKGCNGAELVFALDKAGIACSSGSACAAGASSKMLAAMYDDEERAESSIRFTLNEDNTEEEVDHVLKVLPNIVKKERAREDY